MRRTSASVLVAGLVALAGTSSHASEPDLSREAKRFTDPQQGTQYGRLLDGDESCMAVWGSSGLSILEQHHGGENAWGLRRFINDTFSDDVALDGDTMAYGPTAAGTNTVALHFRNAGGPDRWNHGRTLVTDSAGRVLQLDLDEDMLAVAVAENRVELFARNEGGSDNWGHVITVFSPAAGSFGSALALDCDRMLVAAPMDHTLGASAGRVFVYERHETGANQWGLAATLAAPAPTPGEEFGLCVDLCGDYAIVGGLEHRAYVFYRNQGGSGAWGHVATLDPPAGDPPQQFGRSVSTLSGHALVGDMNDFGTALPGAGAAYLYQRNEGGADNWGYLRTLYPSDRRSSANFGQQVMLQEDAIVVSAHLDSETGLNDGALYTFQNDCFNFVPRLKKKATPLQNGRFGTAVDLWGDVFVASEPGYDSGSLTNRGRVHIHYRNAGSADQWSAIKTVEPEAPLPYSVTSHFGMAIALWDNTMVVGTGSEFNQEPDIGVTLVFERDQGGGDNWGQVKLLLPSGLQTDMDFGRAVDIHCHTIVVGAPHENVGLLGDAGAAYVFARDQGGINNWGEVARLTASDADPADEFGSAVAVFQDTVAVGAPREGVEGACYVFRRNPASSSWQEVARLSPPDGITGLRFGTAVSLFGDLLAVTDPESGDGDNAYLFERNLGGTENWGLRAILNPGIDFQTLDHYGNSVELWEDLVAVSQEDTSTTAHLFERNAGGYNRWGFVGSVRVSSTPDVSNPGEDLSLFGRRLLVADRFDRQVEIFSGAVYVTEPTCLVVDTTNDVVNGGDNLTSLREAIGSANGNTRDDCILLPEGTYPLTLAGSDEDFNATGDFDLLNLGRLGIKGANSKTTVIDGQGLDRVFHVRPGTQAALSGLTIQGGLPPAPIVNGQCGGGIYNQGELSLHHVTVVSNRTSDGHPGSFGSSGGHGGGICNEGELLLAHSTVAYNNTGNGNTTPFGAIGGRGGDGGGIYNATSGVMTMVHSTVSGNLTGSGGSNTGGNPGGPGGSGGGLANLATSGVSAVRHSTIANNGTGPGAPGTPNGDGGDGGGVFQDGTLAVGHLVMEGNTVSAGGEGAAGFGTLTSLDYLLIDVKPGLSLAGPDDHVGFLAALLGPLRENGGPTCTHLPSPGSPAVDAGDSSLGLYAMTDQRGVLRAPNAPIDLGAVETTADFDSDSIPDTWETAEGLDPQNPGDAATDVDQDGYPAGGEYLADTDVFDDDDFPKITAISNNSPTTVYVLSSTDRRYDLFSTTSLLAPQTWSLVTNRNGNGSILGLVDESGTDHREYRVEISLP